MTSGAGSDMVVVMVGKAPERDPLSTTTPAEPPEFVAIMADIGRVHPRMRPWFLRRYHENPAGFGLTAEESWEGHNPPGLFHSKLRAGMHLAVAETGTRVPQRSATNRNGVSRTGWRYVRGSHGGTYVSDPEGTDRPPPDWPAALSSRPGSRKREETAE